MSRHRDPESSLELLLDTMCNTFGGVMFIAIALLVVLSALSKIDEAVETDGDLQELTVKLDELKKETETLRQRNLIRDENIKIIQHDPRRKMIIQIAELEKKYRDLDMQDQVISAENKLLDEKDRRQKSEREQLEKKANSLELELNRDEAENVVLQNEIARIKKEMAKFVSGHISFRMKTYSKKAQYFLIVSKHRLWRVGPDASARVIDDVTHSRNENTVICRLNPAASGIPILHNGSLSRELLQFLSSLPSDRSPHFSLDSDSIAEFCILREYLKKENRPHGIDVQFANYKYFSFIYVQHKVDHEVY